MIIEAEQSSTNGSFVAGLGCDGDLDTFSLTNGGSNQWWSATLDKEYQISWIYVRIKAGNFLFRFINLRILHKILKHLHTVFETTLFLRF